MRNVEFLIRHVLGGNIVRPPLVLRVEALETHRGTAYLRRCLWSLGCQARRAPQDFCTVRNPEARDKPGFKCCFFPFLTTFSVSYVNSSGVEVGARAGAWCFLARGQDCGAFLARHARAWVKNFTCIPSNQKTTPLLQNILHILHLFIIYLRYNITCIPICIYCLLILVFILKTNSDMVIILRVSFSMITCSTVKYAEKIHNV